MKRLFLSLFLVLSACLAFPQSSNRTIGDACHTSGYRGFIDFGGAIGTGGADGVLSLTTSHGYQVVPYFYVGAGLSLDYHFIYGTFLPIFANARVNFINNYITPFFDVKVGYSPIGSGVYFSPTIGVDYSMNRNIGLTFSLGYQMQGADIDQETWYYYGGWYGGYGDYSSSTVKENLGGVVMKFGVHF